MISGQPKWLSHIIFALRILLYLAALVFIGHANQQLITCCITGAIILSLLMDFVSNATLWLSARKGMLCLYFAYFAALVASAYFTNGFVMVDVAVLSVLTLSLSNDAIANSTRWKMLLMALILSLAYLIVRVMMSEDNSPSISHIWTYPLVPVLAILARYLFPHTKHLIHTSLDYRFFRLEILSLGMKRVAAVGIRRNKVQSLP